MKVDKMVPEVYYRGSRDFSFIGRLFEITLNYMKTGSEIVDSNLTSDQCPSFLIELLCNTLGFTIKHKYITKDLLAVASVFSELIRKKGSLDSINLAIQTLLTSQGIKEDFISSFNSKDKTLELLLPDQTTDIVLLEDLFDYILPTGSLVKIGYVSGSATTSTDIETEDSFTHSLVDDQDIGLVYNSQSPQHTVLQEGDLLEQSSLYTATIVSEYKPSNLSTELSNNEES